MNMSITHDRIELYLILVVTVLPKLIGTDSSSIILFYTVMLYLVRNC
jgi:hypothetical protein